jgi:hypothetical protein
MLSRKTCKNIEAASEAVTSWECMYVRTNRWNELPQSLHDAAQTKTAKWKKE